MISSSRCGVGEAHQRQARGADRAVEADVFEMPGHLVAEPLHHRLDVVEVIREGIAHLQVGDRRIDADGAQRRVVPGELVGRRQALEVRLLVGAKHDLALGARGEGQEGVHRMRRDHAHHDALLAPHIFLVPLEIVVRDGRGDRRDQLGQDAVLDAEIVAEARRFHEIVEADDHVDPVIGGGQRHLDFGDDAVGAVGVHHLQHVLAGQLHHLRARPPW